jgi:hypothetical protein
MIKAVMVCFKAQPTMFLPLVLLFVGLANAQTGAEIAYDLFDYATINDLASNGGRGFTAQWAKSSACFARQFSPPQSPNFTSFAAKIQIGGGSGEDACELRRSFAMQFSAAAVATTGFVSFLLWSEGSGSPARKNVFGVSIGTLTLTGGRGWKELESGGSLELDTPVGVMAPFAFTVTHENNVTRESVRTRFDYGGVKTVEVAPSRGVHFFVVIKITPISNAGNRYYNLQLYVYEADFLNNFNASLLDAAPPHRVDPFVSTMSIAMYGFYISQVRIGATFGSVYDDIPSSLTTAPRPTTSGQLPTLPTSTITSAIATSSGAVAVSSASITMTSVTTSVLTATATRNATRETTCETVSIATCSSCLENTGCKWCSATAESESTAGRCVDTNIDGCARLTLAAPGCPIADEQMAGVPIAIIAGASVGGVVVILLIVAVVVCLVMRARSQSEQKLAKASEMTTARESHSIAAGGDESNYSDLRLTSVYSTAGLGTPTSSAESGGLGLAASTSSVSQQHYSQMEMH